MTEPAAAQLDEAGEREWALLHDQFDLADGFWIGFMFSPAYTGPRMMAERVERKLQPAGHALRRWQVAGDSAALRDLPSQVVAAGREGTADCLWVEALENDLGDRPAERSWTAAWSEFLMRLNERREVLVRHHQGALMVVAPPWVKPLVWERAPDLWAFRAIVVELGVAWGSMLPSLASPTAVSNDAPFTPEEERSLGELQRARAGAPTFMEVVRPLLSAAKALVERERRDEARELLVWALSLPRSPNTPTVWVARFLTLLASTEYFVGDKTAALIHFLQANELGEGLDEEVLWHVGDQLARLYVGTHNLPAAMHMAEQALAFARRLESRGRDLASAERLMSALSLLSRLKGMSGDLAAAEELRTEALVLAHRWLRTFGQTTTTRGMLLTALVEIGEIHKKRGAWGPARDALSEAASLGRSLAEEPDASARAWQYLTNAIDMLSAVYAEMGRAEEASRLRDEALALTAARVAPA